MLLKSNSTKLELTTTTTSQEYDYVRQKLLIKLYLIVNTMLKESQMGLGGWVGATYMEHFIPTNTRSAFPIDEQYMNL